MGYNMAVGELPFPGNTLAVILSAIMEKPPVPPREKNPNLPEKLQEIILRALEKDREARYQSARDMLVDLRRLLLESASASESATISSGAVLAPLSPAKPRRPDRRRLLRGAGARDRRRRGRRGSAHRRHGTWSSLAFQQKSRFPEAIAAAKQASEASPNEMLPRAVLAPAYGVTGNKAEAQKVLDHFREVSKRRFISEYDFAVANSGWNSGEALAWLEKGYQNRAGLLVYLRVDSSFDDLRSDPRFQDLVRRIGIPP